MIAAPIIGGAMQAVFDSGASAEDTTGITIFIVLGALLPGILLGIGAATFVLRKHLRRPPAAGDNVSDS